MSLTLTVSGIFKRYDGKAVLRDCSVSFELPGVYALMGPNGSGKSTFLRICALLEAPASGGVAFFDGGAAVPKDISLRRRITLLLPGIGVFNTTVERNAGYGLSIRGIGKKEQKDRVERALEFVGLAQKRRQHALTLSSGETQRLGIARALVLEPEIFFLDEPTASLDDENTAIVEGLMAKLGEERRRIVVVTTHDREQAEKLADRLLILKDGAIERNAGGPLR